MVGRALSENNLGLSNLWSLYSVHSSRRVKLVEVRLLQVDEPMINQIRVSFSFWVFLCLLALPAFAVERSKWSGCEDMMLGEKGEAREAAFEDLRNKLIPLKQDNGKAVFDSLVELGNEQDDTVYTADLARVGADKATIPTPSKTMDLKANFPLRIRAKFPAIKNEVSLPVYEDVVASSVAIKQAWRHNYVGVPETYDFDISRRLTERDLEERGITSRSGLTIIGGIPAPRVGSIAKLDNSEIRTVWPEGDFVLGYLPDFGPVVLSPALDAQFLSKEGEPELSFDLAFIQALSALNNVDLIKGLVRASTGEWRFLLTVVQMKTVPNEYRGGRPDRDFLPLELEGAAVQQDVFLLEEHERFFQRLEEIDLPVTKYYFDYNYEVHWYVSIISSYYNLFYTVNGEAVILALPEISMYDVMNFDYRSAREDVRLFRSFLLTEAQEEYVHYLWDNHPAKFAELTHFLLDDDRKLQSEDLDDIRDLLLSLLDSEFKMQTKAPFSLDELAFKNGRTLRRHFKKHCGEFENGEFCLKDEEEYQLLAAEFVQQDLNGQVWIGREDGTWVKFLPQTYEFAALSDNKTIMTYFKYDPHRHNHRFFTEFLAEQKKR